MEWRRHGFPPGYRFVPEDGELIGLLAMKMREEPLPLPDSVFRDIDHLKYHPQELYEKYKKYMEDGFIYFFSKRTFPKQAHRPKRATKHGRTRKASGDRAMRATEHGGAWKPSGSCKAIVARNGVEIGRVRTMVYYDDKIIDEKTGKKKACDRTELVMQEFMIITEPGTDKVADLALYRIYMKEDNKKRRKERCMEEAGSSSSAQQADDQSMDDGAAVSESQRQCAGAVVTSVYGQGQLFSPCELPPTSVAEGHTDERRDQLVNEPAAMDGVSDRCYGPWSAMAQPYCNYWCAAPAAVPGHLLSHQQPTNEGVYLNGVGYVSGYAYDGFAGAAQSLGLDTAAGVSDEQFKHIMTQEMADQMYSAELNAWSPDDLLADEHCGIGTGHEGGAAPAEPWAADQCRTSESSEGGAAPAAPWAADQCRTSESSEGGAAPAAPWAADQCRTSESSEDGAAPAEPCAAEHCHMGTDLENGAPMGDGGGGGVDDNLSGTLDFLEHGGDGNISGRLELEFCARFLDD